MSSWEASSRVIDVRDIRRVRDESTAARDRRRPEAALFSRKRQPAESGLSVREATVADVPWIETWASTLGLPAQRGRGILSLIFIKDGQRVGYIAAKDDEMTTHAGRVPVRWIMSAFLVPGARGQGLLLRFGALASRKFHRSGRLGARIASNNRRMLKLMSVGGWRRVRTSRQYHDFILDLKTPFGARQA